MTNVAVSTLAHGNDVISKLSTRRTIISLSINRRYFSSIPTKPNGATTLWAELRQLLAFEIASVGKFPSSIDWIVKRAALSWLRKQQLRPGNSGG